MTVSTTASSVTYLGNGATTVFTFPFIGVTAADIEVIYVDADGTSTTLSSGAYTLALNAVPVGGLWGIGGSVTYPIGMSPVPIAAGTTLTINRIVPYEQTISIANQGAFYPQAVEQGLDLLELQIQQLETLVGYSIRCPITDPAAPDVLPSAPERANGYLTFDSFGQPQITMTAPSPGPPVSSVSPRIINTTGTVTLDIETDDSLGGVSIYQTGPAATTLQLPSASGPYPIFDGGLNASTYPIIVLPPSGKTIQGASQLVLFSDGQSVILYNDGSQILID